jgi:Heterokaryon incompatibility protein (HET)
MRLLKRENGIFSLTEFAENRVPEYAILSHTWGTTGEEIGFNDLVGGSFGVPAEGSGKIKGFHKLKFCADQAARDGLEYFWVDTCCIDKSDAVGLQYAINSMFRYYQNAAKCYVYLSDVHSGENRQAAWQPEFLASRWFTRGWTLQELIAPKSVQFFSKEGNRLGDKEMLERQIHEITRIPTKVLRQTPLSQFTVNERMSWMKDRETKYAEDKAYALQGLFGVYLPVIYGEGESNAFDRLRREIERHSLPRTRPSSTVPFRRDPDFLDRDILSTLRQKYRPTSRVALVGLGGVGYDMSNAKRTTSNFDLGSLNLPSSGRTEFKRNVKKPGFSGCMLALRPDSKKDIAKSRTE